LWAYGEDELALQALLFGHPQVSRIATRAFEILTEDQDPSGASVNLTKACALAAVEELEGATRDLHLKRRRPTPVEEPQPVFQAACQAMAAGFSGRGWRYLRTARTMRRLLADFVHAVYFRTSKWNRRGRFVGIDVGGYVCSQVLEEWRAKQAAPLRKGGKLAGVRLIDLVPGHTPRDWNLAPPGERVAVTADVTAHIERFLVPWFAHFEDAERLTWEIERQAVPLLESPQAIEWLLALGQRETARRVGCAALAEDWVGRRPYERALATFRSGGLRREAVYPWSRRAQLAWLAVAHDLEF
jgi:hypothetical protein